VRTARVRVGDAWIVLVSPRSEDSPVANYLETHGEGFSLMSFGVDNLEQAMAELREHHISCPYCGGLSSRLLKGHGRL